MGMGDKCYGAIGEFRSQAAADFQGQKAARSDLCFSSPPLRLKGHIALLAAMTDHEPGYVSRRPRHHVAGPAGPCLTVERSPGNAPESIEAELLDLSRSGVRFRTIIPLCVGESICVRLAHDESGLHLVRSATVCWTNSDRHGTWSVGCSFVEQVDWETLGELFLSGVLSTDRHLPSDA